MFDTMTMTKLVGGFCGALLVFMLGGWASELIYHSGEGGHGEEHAQGYMIEVAQEEVEGAEPVEEIPFEVLMASASAEDGEGLWRNCRSCHALEAGKNGVGPYLLGVVGREVDTAQGYSYSGALELVVDVWTPEHLNEFIKDPGGYAPGTAMGYKGMRDGQDRANLIAYLESVAN